MLVRSQLSTILLSFAKTQKPLPQTWGKNLGFYEGLNLQLEG
jgi:hypothetical protein